MKVKLEYNNKIVEFDDYCGLMNKKILGILYKVDELECGKVKYDDLKKYIFNIAGNISRLPNNIEGG